MWRWLLLWDKMSYNCILPFYCHSSFSSFSTSTVGQNNVFLAFCFCSYKLLLQGDNLFLCCLGCKHQIGFAPCCIFCSRWKLSLFLSASVQLFNNLHAYCATLPFAFPQELLLVCAVKLCLMSIIMELIVEIIIGNNITSSHLSTIGWTVLGRVVDSIWLELSTWTNSNITLLRPDNKCTSVSLSNSMMSRLSVSSGMVPRTKVTVEITTTDMEVKAKIYGGRKYQLCIILMHFCLFADW